MTFASNLPIPAILTYPVATVATRTRAQAGPPSGLRHQVEIDSLLRPEAPYAQLNGVLERLSDLGYYSPEDAKWKFGDEQIPIHVIVGDVS